MLQLAPVLRFLSAWLEEDRAEFQKRYRRYVNPAQTIILKRGRESNHTARDSASETVVPIVCSMVLHRSGAALVAGCADACGCPVDR
ncbi:MAG: hypothetical protein WCB14_16380, partial [Candidatus Acidiferrales bacterium]